MASGSPAPSDPPTRARLVPPPRPGAILTAAAAVPLGVAVLYASGWLAGGPRLALGLAVVVLGNALRGTVGTVMGARITAPVARTAGVVFLVGGALIALGAVVGAFGIDLQPDGDGTGSGGGPGWSLAVWAVPVVVLVATSVAALGVRMAAPLRSLQKSAAASAVVAAVGVLVLTDRVADSSAWGSGEAVFGAGTRVAAVLLLVALVLGTTLLAVLAARLPSRVATLGAVVGTVAAALWAAVVSVATATDVNADAAGGGLAALVLRPLDLVLGFGGPERVLHAADPGWPVLFAIVGVVLAAAAVWVESRRPVPADAPVARPD